MKTIFVSSTFKDMQLERDVIQNKITPKLNIIAREYGDEISFCDLRWGVDTSELESEEGSKKVLEVCLDEIDRCQPPMIVILGDRYGWIPSDTLIEDTAKRKKIELDHLRKSVTALEIEYGALHNEKTAQNTFFYYREIENEFPSDYLSEDEEHKKLLNQLKEKIKRICGKNIKTYKVHYNENNTYELDSFENMIYEDLKQYFMKQWSTFEKKSPFEKESYKHEMYAQAKNNMFRTRNKLVQTCLDSIDKNTYTFIKGEVGSGKSTLFSHLYHILNKTQSNIFIRFCGLTDKSDTALEIFEQLIFYVENKLEIGHKKFDEDATIQNKKKYLEQICSDYDSLGEKCYFMIDAIDQLMDDQIRNNLDFLPRNSFNNIHFVITCINDFNLEMRTFIQIKDLDKNEKIEIIKGILNIYNKELSNSVIENIIKNEMTKNPLYISFIIQRLTMMNQQDFNMIHLLGDGMDAIIKHQLNILETCPKTLKEMSIEVLRVAGERINPLLIDKITKFISISRYGLRIKDLNGIIGDSFNALDFSHFVSYMQNNFIVRENGCYDFSHKSIREGYLYYLSEQEKQNLHQKVTDYLLSLDKEDSIRIDEMAYHMLMANDIKNYTKTIENYIYDKNNKYIRKIAACSKYCALLQDSNWYADIISKTANYVTNRAIVSFLNFDFYYILNNTEKEKDIYRFALKESIKIIKTLRLKENIIPNKIAHAISLLRYGNYQSKENNPYDIYYESLQYINDILEENNHISYRKYKAILLHHLALCDGKNGNIKDTFLKIDYFEEAISIFENIVKEQETKDNYQKLLNVYKNYISFHSLGISSLGKRYSQEYLDEIHQKANNCSEKIIELSNSSKSELGTSYLSLAIEKIKMLVYNDDEIINLLNKAELNYQYVMEYYPTKSNYRAYQNVLQHIAIIYTQLYMREYEKYKYGVIEFREKAIKYFKKSDSISLKLINKYNDVKDKEKYFYSLMKKGDFYRKLGSKYYDDAFVSYFDALMIDDIKEVKKQSIYNYMGDMYRFYKEEELAIFYYKKADNIGNEKKKSLHREYAELREILKYLGKDYVDKIPKDTLEIIESYYSRIYKLPFKGEEWMNHDLLLENTKTLIALFNINFWTDDKNHEKYIDKLKNLN